MNNLQTTHDPSRSFALLRLHNPETLRTSYTLESAAAQAGVHPEMLLHYCRLGLFGEARAQPEGTLAFDDDTLFELRRYEYYRRHHGVERRTLRLLCALWREVDQLKMEVHILRLR